jgi:outer membrane protein OmpA-like peptidoglycan-associated protein
MIDKAWFLVLICFAFLAFPQQLQGQIQSITFEQAVTIFGEQRILKFRKFSLELTDESKEELTQLVEVLRRFPAVLHKNLIIIQTFTCETELNVKPYIAACRGQVVIDYLVEAIGVPRRKCLIQDGGPSQFDKECEIGSGVNLYLKPNWR